MLKSLFKITFLAFCSLMLGYAVTMALYVSPAGAAPDYADDGMDNNAPAGNAPSPGNKNGIAYVTGGIGDAERAEIEERKNEYNFHIVMSTKGGGFVGDTSISLANAKGTVLPETESGPLFYASLPSGTYTATLSHDGTVKQLKVVITPTKPVYLWQSW